MTRLRCTPSLPVRWLVPAPLRTIRSMVLSVALAAAGSVGAFHVADAQGGAPGGAPARAQPGAQGMTQASATPDSRPCNLYFDDTTTTRVHSVKLPSGKYNTFSGGRVIAHCTNEVGVRLKSDSAEYYDAEGLLYLIGHVHYTDPRAVIDAHHMTYFVQTERLLADTNVVAVLPSGTTMHGPHADYLRSIPGLRARAQLTAPGRPHFHLVQRDSNSTQSDTAGVDANLVYMDGDSLLYASKKVVIKRTDLIAHGDSAFMNQGTGFARLMIHPLINGTQEKHPFTLKGDVIDLYTVNHQLVRVVSIRHADAISKDMHLTADTIDMRFTDKVLSRDYAWGPSRAHATTPERDILADSLDVLMPGQVVHQIRAVRKAYATGEPDTTQFKSKERDWLKGDTIFAYFDTSNVRPKTADAPPPPPSPNGARLVVNRLASQRATRDTAPAAPAADSQPELRTLVSDGDAHAFYQLPPKDKTLKRPAIDYTRGRTITIQFEHRQVQTITVVDSAVGVYLEPQADTISKDSARRARALTDTLAKPKKGRKRGKGQARSGANAASAHDSTKADSISPTKADSTSPAAPAPSTPPATPEPGPDSGAAPAGGSPPPSTPPQSAATGPVDRPSVRETASIGVATGPPTDTPVVRWRPRRVA